ncbi:MAG: hypothetical protein M3N95_07770 [Actinomycetota bacterium]|nr:hypothetical protein [Actinomycetota bacterium]
MKTAFPDWVTPNRGFASREPSPRRDQIDRICRYTGMAAYRPVMPQMAWRHGVPLTAAGIGSTGGRAAA